MGIARGKLFPLPKNGKNATLQWKKSLKYHGHSLYPLGNNQRQGYFREGGICGMQFRESHDQVLQLVTCTVHSCESSERGSPGNAGQGVRYPHLLNTPSKFTVQDATKNSLWGHARPRLHDSYSCSSSHQWQMCASAWMNRQISASGRFLREALVAVSNVDQMPSWPKPSRCCRSPCPAGPQTKERHCRKDWTQLLIWRCFETGKSGISLSYSSSSPKSDEKFWPPTRPASQKSTQAFPWGQFSSHITFGIETKQLETCLG